MTPEQIESILKNSAAQGLTTVQLGRMLSEPPHALLPADATQIMDQYRRKYPNAAAAKFIKKSLTLADVKKAAKVIRELPQPAVPVVVPEEDASPRQQTYTVRSAVKELALELSVELRNGRFERVASEFLDGIEATVGATIRGIGKSSAPRRGTRSYVTGRAARDAQEMLNQVVEAAVRSRVQSHPSSGKTLK